MRVLKTSNSNMSMSVAVWLAHDTYDHSDDPKLISATSILKPLKSIVLSRSTENVVKEVPIEALIPSVLGSSIHTAIEAAWNADNLQDTLLALGYPSSLVHRIVVNPTKIIDGMIPVYMEQRSTKEIEGFKVSGKFDFVMDGALEDFKTTSVVTWMTQSNADKYVAQGSIYRWLNPEIITQDHMTIQYIFTDWSAAKAKQDPQYPQSRIIGQKYPLWSINKTEAYIKSKLAEVNRYLNQTQENIPACTKEELWQRDAVFKYYKNPNNKTRSTKNFETYAEAHQRYLDDGSVGEIIEVPGEVVFCRYCEVVGICDQARDYIQKGLLNM